MALFIPLEDKEQAVHLNAQRVHATKVKSLVLYGCNSSWLISVDLVNFVHKSYMLDLRSDDLALHF